MKATAQQYALAFFALQTGATVQQLTACTGWTRQTVAKVLQALHEQGLVYVDDWAPDALGRWRVAIWALGDGPDAPRPGAKTAAAKQREYRQRRRLAE